jgi:orotidine-5'-phosphate decarboxylase
MTKLLVAVDTSSRHKYASLFKLGQHIEAFKFGLEFFWAGLTPAPNSVIDAKLKDIPNTVQKAVENIIQRYQPKMLIMHADSGAAAIAAARQVIDAASSPCKLVAVTVLTSLEPDSKGQLSEIGVFTTPKLQSLRLAKLAQNNGAHGIVVSGEELLDIKLHFPDLLTVVPGVRMRHGLQHDQKRVTTPDEAAYRGADYVVVGRPITDEIDTVSAALAIKLQLQAGTERRQADDRIKSP